ncbi:MAG: hypothetical protein OEV15_02230 [Gallionella sp.]|nr:hypothetical protein [Gallionella sp.]
MFAEERLKLLQKYLPQLGANTIEAWLGKHSPESRTLKHDGNTATFQNLLHRPVESAHNRG